MLTSTLIPSMLLILASCYISYSPIGLQVNELYLLGDLTYTTMAYFGELSRLDWAIWSCRVAYMVGAWGSVYLQLSGRFTP